MGGFFLTDQKLRSESLKMSGAVAKIARPPQMRNFISSVLKKHMAIALGLSVVTTTAYYVGVFKPRKEAYRNFYATYDPDKAYAEMKKTGIFHSTAVMRERPRRRKRRTMNKQTMTILEEVSLSAIYNVRYLCVCTESRFKNKVQYCP